MRFSKKLNGDTLNESEDDFIFKISVVGDGECGKTSLIRKYTSASFELNYIKTIGAQFSTYEDEIDGLKCKLSLWDIAGQDDHHFLRPTFYKGSKGAIVVFSLEDSDHGRTSFDHVDEWFNGLKHNCGNIPVVLFGNKVDLVDESQLEEEKILKQVEKLGFNGYFKTSAKTGNGVIEAFRKLIKDVIDLNSQECSPE